MYGLHVMGYVGIALIISAISSPTIFGEDVSSNFISKSSEDITHVLFQNHEKSESNYIFSPFGYSIVLGILSEGARGVTREELTRVLHLPENEGTIRKNFKTTLQRLHERSAAEMPEFRTYFYVYKNFTIDDNYKTTLLENYFTDVRNVDRHGNHSSQDTNEFVANGDDIQVIEEPESTSSTPDETATASVTSSPITSSANASTNLPPHTSPVETTTKTEDKTPIEADHEESTNSSAAASSLGNGTMGKLEQKIVAQVLSGKNLLKNGKRVRMSSIDRSRLKRLAKRFLGINIDDGARHYSDMMSARISSQQYTNTLSRILVFNGLYFKGHWKIPFQRAKGEETFYKNGTEKISAKMMYTTGEFDMGQIPELDSALISLPYKSERYSFMIILPNRRDGIQNLTAGLDKFDLSDVRSRLQRRHVHITMPIFQFDTTSYLKESLKMIGVRRIFTREADFTGLSRDTGLFVDDIVQLVTIKVDNEGGTPNFMTASSVETRTVTEKFNVDHPFVFLIVDRKDDLIITAGQLYEPTRED